MRTAADQTFTFEKEHRDGYIETRDVGSQPQLRPLTHVENVQHDSPNRGRFGIETIKGLIGIEGVELILVSVVWCTEDGD